MSTSQVHAHALFDLIESFHGGIAPEELRTLSAEKFGASSFKNCEGREFSFDEFLVFARERNKITEQDGKLSLVRSNICNGEH